MSQQPSENSDSQQPDADPPQQADSSTNQNSVQGNQNRVVQGDENQAVMGDGNTVNQIRASVVNIIKKPVSIAVATLTAIVGTVGIIFAGKHNVINIGGNVESGATVANELKIYKGDPPEVRQRKLEQAKHLIAEEVLTNISNMDARLGFVGIALADDNFDERLRNVRTQVAPSLNQDFDSGYRRLMRQQEISSLRGAFASRPVYELREPLIQVLIEGNANAEQVRLFYNNLTEVQDVSESLFQELSTAAAQTSTNPRIITHHEKRIKLAVERLINRSKIAHLYGLIVLDSLKIPLPNVLERIKEIQHLEPRRFISKGEATQLLAEQFEDAKRLLAERAVIVEEAKTLRNSTLDEYARLNEKLTIQPSDSWNVVVGKAVSLRQLGRTTEAVAAFSRYSEMFAEKDPTAEQYSRTAQQFTIQLDNLRVRGGVYLYKVVQDGVADRAGLKVGDIVIGYGEKNITSMSDITMALRDALIDDSIRLTYLRMSDAGRFQRQEITVSTGSLGVGMMPI